MVFAQFRSQYPQGSIQTEILPKIDGQFVFRASLSDGHQLLSTATAMDIDLEAAEERAIHRALDFAGIGQEKPTSMQASLMPSPPVHHHTPSLSPSPAPTPMEMSYVHTPELDFYTPSSLSEPLPKNSAPNSAPDDLSDEIAQTKVEMERLGWTNEQGKEYLMRTFGKKSRQQLSPSELRQFLGYLKSLPTRL